MRIRITRGRAFTERDPDRLAILPNLTHYEIFLAPELVRTARPFLDGKTGAPTWSGQVQGQAKPR